MYFISFSSTLPLPLPRFAQLNHIMSLIIRVYESFWRNDEAKKTAEVLVAVAAAVALVGWQKQQTNLILRRKLFIQLHLYCHLIAFVLLKVVFLAVWMGFLGLLFYGSQVLHHFPKSRFPLFRCVVSATWRRAKNDEIYNDDDRKSVCAVFNLNRKLSVLYIYRVQTLQIKWVLSSLWKSELIIASIVKMQITNCSTNSSSLFSRSFMVDCALQKNQKPLCFCY